MCDKERGAFQPAKISMTQNRPKTLSVHASSACYLPSISLAEPDKNKWAPVVHTASQKPNTAIPDAIQNYPSARKECVNVTMFRQFSWWNRSHVAIPPNMVHHTFNIVAASTMISCNRCFLFCVFGVRDPDEGKTANNAKHNEH